MKARCDVFDRYVEALGGIEGVHFMPELEGTYSNRWMMAMTLDPENIEARPVWKPLHMQPLFAEGLCLPSGSNMTMDEQERVISI